MKNSLKRTITILLSILLIAGTATTAFGAQNFSLAKINASLQLPDQWKSYQPGQKNADPVFLSGDTSLSQLQSYCEKSAIALMATDESNNAELIFYVKNASHDNFDKMDDEKLLSTVSEIYGLSQIEGSLESLKTEVITTENQRFYHCSGYTMVEEKRSFVECYVTINNAKVMVARIIYKNSPAALQADIAAIFSGMSFQQGNAINQYTLLCLLLAALFFALAIRMSKNNRRKMEAMGRSFKKQ